MDAQPSDKREYLDFIYLWRFAKLRIQAPIFWIILMLGMIAGALWYIGIALSNTPHYALASAKDANDNPMVWRLNTRTGDLETCSYGKDPFYSLLPGNEKKTSMVIGCINEFDFPNQQ